MESTLTHPKYHIFKSLEKNYIICLNDCIILPLEKLENIARRGGAINMIYYNIT